MEKVKKLYAAAEPAEARVQVARVGPRRAYCQTPEELGVKVRKETTLRIAKSSPRDDRDITTTGVNSRDSDGDVDMEELTTAAAPKNDRL